MFIRLGDFISRHWLATILFWIVLCVALRMVAPSWSEISHDGDLAYLPASMKSVRGERILSQAFPHTRSKSQIVIVAARQNGSLKREDAFVTYDLGRRLRNWHGAAALNRIRQWTVDAKSLESEDRNEEAQALRDEIASELHAAENALDEAIRFDQKLAKYAAELAGEHGVQYRPWASAYHNRAIVYRLQGKTEEASQSRQRATELDPKLRSPDGAAAPIAEADLPLLDMWTWDHETLSKKLSRDHARLIVLHLGNEFLATDNIRILNAIEREMAEVEETWSAAVPAGLKLGVSGSAAVGGEMLRASAESIGHTETFTVAIIFLILLLVYRSPLLVGAPLAAITVSLLVAMSSVALLTQVGQLPGFSWWDLKVFTTTRIFVVVILFGAGTDFCLFLIARYREEREAGHPCPEAVSRSLGGVGEALSASALTTVVGLSAMYFADFGKFKHSGPVIGFCLLVTLAACLTLAPALLRGFGDILFWPGKLSPRRMGEVSDSRRRGRLDRRVWWALARRITAHPGVVLVTAAILLAPMAAYGWRHADHVTYDFLRALPRERPAREGAELLRGHFPIGESGPITVVAVRPGADFNEDERSRQAVAELTSALYLDGVRAVRSLSDPLGVTPPHEKGVSAFSWRGLRTRFLRPHQGSKDVYVAQAPGLRGEATRLDIVLQDDPFSPAAANTLASVDARLHELTEQPGSFWSGADFAYAGATAGIRDLRAVTQSDTQRIQLLVVLAVLGVLLAILRRPLVCVYMVGSVLVTYYVTLGATDLFFGWYDAGDYYGLDWKVPLFLFVILVAVGQDYNVYLATRVFEEQAHYGPFGGLRRALVRTGGVITSCGVIMAGAFFSMTSGLWAPAVAEWIPPLAWLLPSGGAPLRGIVQLGFALALGVTLDTFVVRPILVPSFLALLVRWQAWSVWVVKAGAARAVIERPAPNPNPN
ncbi:MAG: MMPL family transporter [Planctomycetes bacterium]|nr:MMPL family transporter [Planctomycetota bacterium]